MDYILLYRVFYKLDSAKLIDIFINAKQKNTRKIIITKTIVDFQTFTTYSKDNFFVNLLALV